MEVSDVLLATRQHWSVENSLHWVLDVAFNEDHSRARQAFAAGNLATTRQVALNLLKQEKTTKMGIKNKRKRCGWSQQYLESILDLVSWGSCFCPGEVEKYAVSTTHILRQTKQAQAFKAYSISLTGQQYTKIIKYT